MICSPNVSSEFALGLDFVFDSVLGDDLRDTEGQHNQQILICLLHQPRRGQQNDDDVEAENHSEQLGLKSAEAETLDNDVGESTQTGRWESGAQSDEAITPNLRIFETFDELLLLEFPVLDTGLVITDSLDDLVLFLLGEALGSHGRVWHPEEDKDAEDDGDDAVG